MWLDPAQCSTNHSSTALESKRSTASQTILDTLSGGQSSSCLREQGCGYCRRACHSPPGTCGLPGLPDFPFYQLHGSRVAGLTCSQSSETAACGPLPTMPLAHMQLSRRTASMLSLLSMPGRPIQLFMLQAAGWSPPPPPPLHACLLELLVAMMMSMHARRKQPATRPPSRRSWLTCRPWPAAPRSSCRQRHSS